MHLRIRASEGRIFAVVSREPTEALYHPSVDQLFESAAIQLGSPVMGVVLTGMGTDGLQGAQAICQAGGLVLAESASSCVVFGMPRAVIESGIVRAEAPIEGISSLIVDHMFRAAD
jgi:two-component system, chemotaxis family, protein-glutamate methylesterase/glutaminase